MWYVQSHFVCDKLELSIWMPSSAADFGLRNLRQYSRRGLFYHVYRYFLFGSPTHSVEFNIELGLTLEDRVSERVKGEKRLMKNAIKFIMVVLMMVSLVVLTGCGTSTPPTPVEKTILKVGTEAAYAPIEYQDDKADTYIGFHLDLVKAVGEAADMDVKI